MSTKSRVGIIFICFLNIYLITYSFNLSPLFYVYRPPHHDLLLIDPHVLACLTCPINQTQFVHYASFSGVHGHRKGKLIHKAYNDNNKDFTIFDLNGEKRAVRKFQTEEVTFNGVKVIVPVDRHRFVWEWNRGRLIDCEDVKMDRDPTESRVISLDFVNEMADLRDLMISYNVTPMLSDGSLLGWYRECSIIPHTTDIDFVVLYEEHSEALIEALKNSRKFVTYWMLGKYDDCFELTVYRKGIKIDIFYAYGNDDHGHSTTCVMKIWKKEKILLKQAYLSSDNICAADFLGRLMYVNCNAREAIETSFGKDWKQDYHSANYSTYTEAVNLLRTEVWPNSIWNQVYRVVRENAQAYSLKNP
ncbi:hypothetical protein QR680_010232 [Steinernema hermaphroditum]|uniref:LicD/FKTN/FKRP nucleotidyltransferase domain-containing protein n=1 Tax=Steinernema hermaphroditum TaxID=289476 RepID=A0AA39IQW9_9BILA|nr:hypothetical protein QR680_010232 [Steinernema hermaphroditum]